MSPLGVPVAGRVVEGLAAGAESYRWQIRRPGLERHVQVDGVSLARSQRQVPDEVVTVDVGGVRFHLDHRLRAEPGVDVAER